MSRKPSRVAEVRNVRFDIGPEVPRHWLDGRKSVTTFLDNLSIFFPVGERFFIASVRAHSKHLSDPRLLEDVRLFCGQEGVHGREHDQYNEHLERQGYRAREMESRVDRLLKRVTKLVPARLRLGATCALEHFTSLMAHMLLADPRVLEGANEQMAALWKWHSAEENEHKSVAYDVFVAAGGTYPERVATMVLASLIFWAKVFEHQVRMMRVDGTATSLAEWSALVRWLFVEPGAIARMIPLYFQYYRPGFHPDDIDATALFEAWKREYESAGVYRQAA
jgi:predicted metal-dependent hydrolase